jgi:hypothetical protein
MAHYAHVENGIVTQVIVADQDFINSGAVGDPSTWVQTSYNTYAGEHRNGGTPLRKNYAGIGHIYDSVRDAFYAPSPFPSWLLNEHSCVWEAPTPMPTDDKRYTWNESNTSWDEIAVIES